MTTTYTKIHKIPRGHSYWMEIATGAGATRRETMLVADGSLRNGRDPTSGDDGRLEVDVQRIRDAGLTLNAGEHLWAPVPLVGGTHTGADIEEAAWLAGYFGVALKLKAGDRTFVLTEEE